MMGTITEPAAARTDRAEAAFWATYARNIATTDDTRDSGAVPVAGGYALCVQGTYLEYAIAVGSKRPLRPDDMRIIDEFYGGRGLPSRLELHPAVVARDGELLAAWGYEAELPLAVLERDLLDAGLPAPELAVETSSHGSAEWVEMMLKTFDAERRRDPARTLRTAQVCAAAAGAVYGVRIGGRLAGGGALAMVADGALLYCGGTLPEFRGRGIHAALVGARLIGAKARGATYAFLKATPGSPAERSALRAGFVRTHERLRMRRRS